MKLLITYLLYHLVAIKGLRAISVLCQIWGSLFFISKGFLKQLTIKTNGKNSRRFDRSSVIIQRNVENMTREYILWPLRILTRILKF